jgi:transposase
MSKVRIKVECEPSVIKSQLRKDEKYSQGVRLYAVYQISIGKNSEYLVELYGSSHKSICNWVSRYNAEGIDGLKDRRRSGRPAKLSMEDKLCLKKAVIENPEDQGYSSGIWTWALVADFIAKRFGVSYKKAQIYNILHSINLSYQKGKGFYPEAFEREEKVEAIKKTP